ncbi:hypothetical protein [Halomarina pelagica]|nr:hypothetical protein [Halomarina sp. BND7]
MSTRTSFGCRHLTVVPENFDPDAERARRFHDDYRDRDRNPAHVRDR